MSFKDLTGQKFGRLIAIKRVTGKNQKTKWLCKCDCGNEKEILLSSLVSGKSKSCGCFRKEVTGKMRRKHGYSNNRLYNIWLGMRNRCYNPNNSSYKNYGGRGIEVCSEWDDFRNFKSWATKNGYEESLTLDRINNCGNYEPNNCRWVSRLVQANNNRKNVLVKVNGEAKTLSETARKYNINYFTLHYRYHEKGLRGKELIQPLKRKRSV